MTLDEPTTVVPRALGPVAPIRLAYARVAPRSGGVLPDLDSILRPGKRLQPRSQRQWGGASAEFVLGDMLTDQSLRIVAGRLGYQVGVEETIEVFDSSSDGFVPETIIRPETVTGYFVVHLDEGWLMVEEIGSRLPTDNFIEILASFINEEMFYDSQRVTAQLLRVTESPWRFVSRVERVVSVTFSVTPSNPGKRWREMDEQLKKARARRLKERYENKEGLNVPSDDDESDAEENPIGLGIAMTLAGYGDPRELSIVGTFRSRPAEYDGGVGASLLFDEIAVQDASDREDPEQMLPRIIRVLDESVQVGVPFGWRRGSASEST